MILIHTVTDKLVCQSQTLGGTSRAFRRMVWQDCDCRFISLMAWVWRCPHVYVFVKGIWNHSWFVSTGKGDLARAIILDIRVVLGFHYAWSCFFGLASTSDMGMVYHLQMSLLERTSDLFWGASIGTAEHIESSHIYVISHSAAYCLRRMAFCLDFPGRVAGAFDGQPMKQPLLHYVWCTQLMGINWEK